MVLPWDLLASAAAATAVAAVVLWWRTRTVDTPVRGEVVDRAALVVLAGLIGGRVIAVLIDVGLSGPLPAVAWPRLTAGVSVPGAVAAALAAAALSARRRTLSALVAREAAVALLTALAVWALFSLLRGDAAGLAAAPPWGVVLPGSRTPAVPVGLLEGGLYAVAAVLTARLTGRRRPVLAAAGSILAVSLLGSALRPPTPTADGTIDVLLGLAVLMAVAAAALPRPAVAVRTAAAALAVGAVLAAGAVTLAAAATTGPLLTSPGSAAPAGSAALDGALVAGGGFDAEAALPAWDAADLAGFVAAQDGPVVVNFWASWCGPCHAEAPALARTLAALPDVAAIGVLIDDDPQRAAEFVERYRLPFATVGDGGIRAALAMAGLPTTVVLDADGREVARLVGGLDAAGLSAAVARAEASSAQPE